MVNKSVATMQTSSRVLTVRLKPFTLVISSAKPDKEGHFGSVGRV
jgi:hypothetical protein